MTQVIELTTAAIFIYGALALGLTLAIVIKGLLDDGKDIN